jgi:23S rRNA (uridine2552-2'-O)-methyltransferase
VGSVDWIALRGRDRYYRLAKRLGVPSRAYFKLAQLNNKYGFLASGARVIDLGSSPGGWLSYELEQVGQMGRIVAVDIDNIKVKSPENLVFIQKDIFNLDPNELLGALGGRANVFLSDLAPRFTGIRSVDIARHYDLALRALELSSQTLDSRGWLVIKLYMSPEVKEFVSMLRQRFERVKLEKPSSSRPSSSEVYAVCHKVCDKVTFVQG